MGETRLFFRGVPTEPDVTALNNLFGVPEEGAPISYAAVAEALRVPATGCRFKTVTNAWRKGLRATHGIIMVAGNGQFEVRDPASRVALGKTKTKSGVRCFSESVEIITGTDRARLTERERGDADKVQRIASLAQAAALAEARKRPVPALRAVNEREGAATG